MSPEQLIKLAILQLNAKWGDKEIPPDITGGQVDEMYEALEEADEHWDAKSEVREGSVETEIPSEYSRHYESKSVATQVNGQWVGWTYWYGGGKHGEPEAIDWMEDAYLLDCVEEEKVVTVRTFAKQEQAA